MINAGKLNISSDEKASLFDTSITLIIINLRHFSFLNKVFPTLHHAYSLRLAYFKKWPKFPLT